MQRGITEIVSFVPWQGVEADISHALTRFLQLAAERRLGVSLIVSPEVGVAAPSSGIPRDVLAKPECLAIDSDGNPCVSIASPQAHALPSLVSPEFQKRYQSYLQRVDHFLVDALKRGGEGVGERVSLILTGSFWKYYRSPRASAADAFGGPAGEYSSVAGIQFRNRVEQRYSQPEYGEPSPSSANRWKLKSMEEINRRWWMQQSEDEFRERAAQFFGRKALSIPLEQMELFSPESDPSYLFQRVLAHMAGAKADFWKLSSIVDAAAVRRSQVMGQPTAPWLHWSGSGAFSSLSSQEKQFLILKSLLLTASQGGGVILDSEDWFALSDAFRRRAEALARSLAQGDYRLRQKACYWSPHLWSHGGGLWEELQQRLGSQARLMASPEFLRGEVGQDAGLLVVDPRVILTRAELVHLLAWTRGGRVTAIPRSHLYTERARAELLRVTQGELSGGRLDLHVGIPFELYITGQGKLLVYDSAALEKTATPEVYRQFMQALLGLASVESSCAMGDRALEVIALEKKSGGQGVFILNPGARTLDSDLHFADDVMVEDLGQQIQQEGAGVLEAQASSGVAARRFHLEVPAWGVLPLQVRELAWSRELSLKSLGNVDLSKQKDGAPLGRESSRSDSLWN
jgi:hypothetical protein